MQKIKKFTIIHYSLLALSLIYSFVFYKEISIELAVLAVLFELFKPVLFINAYKGKGATRTVFTVLVVILVVFNLLAISSSFINTYNKQTTSQIINEDYTIHNKRLNELKSSLDSVKTELNNYPTLAEFTSKSPKWEDKTILNKNWQDGKLEITNRLNIANTEYNKELSVKVEQYKTKENKLGYSAVFTAISNKLNIQTMNLILILYLLFAVMLEILIFYSKTLSNKELNSYKKTGEELTQELMQEMQLELHRRQLEAIKNSFSNNTLSNNNMPLLIREAQKNDTKIYVEEKAVVKEIESPKNDVGDPALKNEEVEEVDLTFEDLAIKNKYQYQKKALDIENIRKYLNYLLENSKDDIAIGYKKVGESLGLTQGESQRIYSKLVDANYLEKADKRTTKIKKTNFNENDFLEV